MGPYLSEPTVYKAVRWAIQTAHTCPCSSWRESSAVHLGPYSWSVACSDSGCSMWQIWGGSRKYSSRWDKKRQAKYHKGLIYEGPPPPQGFHLAGTPCSAECEAGCDAHAAATTVGVPTDVAHVVCCPCHLEAGEPCSGCLSGWPALRSVTFLCIMTTDAVCLCCFLLFLVHCPFRKGRKACSAAG